MIPFPVQKVWESSAPDVDKLVENGGDDCGRVYFKVEACLLGESEQLF